MNNSIMDLSILQLSLSYLIIIAVLLVVKSRGMKRERQIIIATMRMTLQLTLMGYVLMYVFDHPSWWLTSLLILLMIGFAVFNGIKRVKTPMSKELKRIIAISMVLGGLAMAGFFIIVILHVRPWYHPQYFIPIAGMIIGNTMTGISLGANKLCSDMQDKRHIIENSLMLGATPARATREIINSAFDSAILPTMNTMLTMGVVALPGMMTGQILSGTFPLTAIKYQIGIMLAILGSTALATLLFVVFGYQTFFTKDSRLK